MGNLHHLQWLDLSHNVITDIDPETFRYTKRLQVIKLQGNFISELPADLFRYSRAVRIVDLSYNAIRVLQENFFGGDGMEDLNLSHNLLTKVPALSLSNLAALTMCRLNLNHNHIANIQSIDLSNKFRVGTDLIITINVFLFAPHHSLMHSRLSISEPVLVRFVAQSVNSVG